MEVRLHGFLKNKEMMGVEMIFKAGDVMG